MKRLFDEFRTRESVVHPERLPTAFGDGRDARVGLQFRRGVPARAIRPQRRRQARGAHRPGPGEALEERVIRVLRKRLGNAGIERLDRTQRRQLVWMDRSGKLLSAIGSPDESNLSAFALDPAGQRLAVTRAVLGNFDVWLMDANRGVPTRFTFDPIVESSPLWSPDGRRVIFMAARGLNALFEKPASGAGDAVAHTTPWPPMADS